LPKIAAHNKRKNKLSMGCRFSEKIFTQIGIQVEEMIQKEEIIN
jgi:hypothetical protein